MIPHLPATVTLADVPLRVVGSITDPETHPWAAEATFESLVQRFTLKSQIPRHRLQLGGERGYGWGWVEPAGEPLLWEGQPLFGGLYTVKANSWPPVLRASEDAPLLAHALAADFDEKRRAVQGVDGAVEPLVGRETSPDGRFGVQVSPARICYAPGSRVQANTRFRIGPYGVWEAMNQT